MRRRSGGRHIKCWHTHIDAKRSLNRKKIFTTAAATRVAAIIQTALMLTFASPSEIDLAVMFQLTIATMFAVSLHFFMYYTCDLPHRAAVVFPHNHCHASFVRRCCCFFFFVHFSFAFPRMTLPQANVSSLFTAVGHQPNE